jgi:hypothetical protein
MLPGNLKIQALEYTRRIDASAARRGTIGSVRTPKRRRGTGERQAIVGPIPHAPGTRR